MGYLELVITAGLDVVRLKKREGFYLVIQHYYEMINGAYVE